MAQVTFRVQHTMAHPAREVFDALVDWRGHARWVPMTSVEILQGDGGVGTVFVATTGLGPLALADRMRVEVLDEAAMSVRIVKIGPVLTGDVHLQVASLSEGSSEVTWLEDIAVSWLPQFAARPTAALTSQGFRSSLRRLDRRLREPESVQPGPVQPGTS